MESRPTLHVLAIQLIADDFMSFCPVLMPIYAPVHSHFIFIIDSTIF